MSIDCYFRRQFFTLLRVNEHAGETGEARVNPQTAIGTAYYSVTLSRSGGFETASERIRDTQATDNSSETPSDPVRRWSGPKSRETNNQLAHLVGYLHNAILQASSADSLPYQTPPSQRLICSGASTIGAQICTAYCMRSLPNK